MVTRETLIIRDARPDERVALREVVLAAYREYAVIMPEPLWAGYRRQLLATIDSDGAVERIVAERTGDIVGSVLLFPPATNAYAMLSQGSRSAPGQGGRAPPSVSRSASANSFGVLQNHVVLIVPATCRTAPVSSTHGSCASLGF